MTPSTASDDVRRRHPTVVEPTVGRFAHPSEREFARLLSLYGLTWLYEPVEFPLSWDDRGTPKSGFRPDFYLCQSGVFIELTVLDQRLVTRKNKKVRLFRELYPEVLLVVVYRRAFQELLRHHDLAAPEWAA